jgi:ligand-binding sensor domain-containing protein
LPGILLAYLSIFSAVIFSFIPHKALSAPVEYWAHFTRENSDLPNDSVLALALGSDGALWVGTNGSGLARLDKDGRWQTYTRANTNGSLPGDDVRALALGSDGVLWVGTNASGLARLDKDGRWNTYTRANTNGGLPGDNVLALALGSDGALWVGTYGGGLARLDKDGRWNTYTQANTNGGLPDDGVLALALGPDGALWVAAASSGLARLDKDGRWNTYTRANTNGSLPHDDVRALAVASDGALWIGTFGGLARLDKGGHWNSYTRANTNDSLPQDVVRALALGANGALWVATVGGLARLDKDGRWRTYTRANTDGGLPHDDVWALALGSDDALWVGTNGGGLAQLDKDRRWDTYTRGNTHAGLPHDDVRALALGSDGALWVGTHGGVAWLDKGGRWQTYTRGNTNGGLPDDDVQALALDSDGALWVGTNGGGLARLDKDGRWQTYTRSSTNGALRNDAVLALALGSNGALWIGTNGGGVARLDKDGRWSTYTRRNTNGVLPGDYVQALALGSDGGLWVGTVRGGLARLDKDGRWNAYQSASTDGAIDQGVRALALGSDGALWVGTSASGLARLDKNGRRQTYTRGNTNGGLPEDGVQAFAPGSDGALWVATNGGGLARLDKDGRWQTYTRANTNGGLPNDDVQALALGSGGALWIGTTGGVANLDTMRTSHHRIVEVIGSVENVTQREHTVVAIAFDRSHFTQPGMFRYAWRVYEQGLLRDTPASEIETKSPIYTAKFDHDGVYKLEVVAIDRYGIRSDPYETSLKVTLPKPNPARDMLVTAVTALSSAGLLYFALIFPLIPLYPHFSWARTAANSGIFTKFPFLHKAVLNTAWARRNLFFRLVAGADTAALPTPYIPQSLFATKQAQARQLTLDGSRDSLKLLFASQRRALVIARSGTGKSVFLRFLQREVAARFHRGEDVPVPLLIDLRTHVLAGRSVLDLVRDALRGAGVELGGEDLDFLVRKGGFLILVDSLNELPNLADAQLFHTFFNQDAYNQVLIASQLDLIRRDDVHVFNLAEVSPEQAAKYLADATGRDLYPGLPSEAQMLARNPQDLALLAEVARALGTAPIPTRRAELYREILAQDGALRPWVENSDARIGAIYALAYRMVSEQNVLPETQMREWIAAEVDGGGDAVTAIVRAIGASGLFVNEAQRDILGKERLVTGFRHELIGKFLAARHVRRAMTGAGVKTPVDWISLSGADLWQDVFYFVIDEMDSSQALNRFLVEMLAAGGHARMRIAAYAIGTKKLVEPSSDVRQAYANAKLKEDLALTPAA